MNYLIITGINPEPWALGTVSTSRKAGGGFRGGLSPNAKLVAYQAALKEELATREITPLPDDVKVRLHFYFARQIEVYHTPSGRQARGHVADATNLQKATEDALQGLLFKNDNMTTEVISTIIAQDEETEPSLIIGYEVYRPVGEEKKWYQNVVDWWKSKQQGNDNSW